MVDAPTGPNTPDNPYYERQNHVRLAKGDYNRSEFFGTIGGVPSSPYTVTIGTGPFVSGTLLETDIIGLVGGETITYQFTRNGVNISGATSADYDPTIGVDGVQDGDLIRSVATIDGTPYTSVARVVTYAAAVNTVAPVVSGSLGLGDTLSVTNGTWTGAVGGTYSYQWRRNDVNIAGATSDEYDIQLADSGAALECRVTYTNSGGAVSALSNEVTVQTFAAPNISGVPTISGTSTVGQTLTATPASVTGNPTPVRTWQWERSGNPIGSATNTTYLLVEADEGETITVVQTETNALGVGTAESAATAEIAAAPEAVNPIILTADFTDNNDGTPADLAVTYTYAGADTLRAIIATRNGGSALTAAQLIAGSGTFLERVIVNPFSATTFDLTGFTATSNAATAVDVLVAEVTNGGASSVVTEAVTGLDFTAPTFSSAEATDANTVVVTLTEAVYGTNDASDWAFDIDGVAATIAGVSGTGSTRTLTVSDTMTDSDVLDELAYTPGDLSDGDGNALAAFSGQAITNNVPSAYTAPAYVSGSMVLMTSTSTTVRTSAGVTIPEGTAYILIHYETGHRTVSSLTFNGNACTPIYFAQPHGTSLGFISHGAYKIEVGPGGETGDIVLTASGDLLSARGFCAVWGGGVNVAEGSAASGIANIGASDSIIDVDVTTLAGDDAIALLGPNDQGFETTTPTNFTKRGDVAFSGARKRAYALDATGLSAGSPLDVDFTITNSGTVRLAGVVLPLRSA